MVAKMSNTVLFVYLAGSNLTDAIQYAHIKLKIHVIVCLACY